MSPPRTLEGERLVEKLTLESVTHEITGFGSFASVAILN
jgi:hypothetical protein